MRRICSELGFTFALFLAALFLYQESLLLPPPRFEPMGPGFFPKMLLMGILALCGWNLVLGALRLCRTRGDVVQACSGNDDGRYAWRVPVVALLFAGFLGLVVLTDWPFLALATLFSMFLGFLLSGWNRRALVTIALSSLGVTGFIYVVFGLLLQSFFP